MTTTMSDLELFSYDGAAVRVVTIDGEPWFVVADIARILGYRDAHNAARLLRDIEVRTHQMSTNGVLRDVTLCSEPGLYRLIMRSNQPAAAPFQDWVTGEVLPSIRKTGQYAVAEQFAIPRTYAEALELAAEQARSLEAQQAELTAARPKVDFYDRYVDADGNYKVGDVAKVLAIPGLGQNKLFQALREEGELISGGKSHNSPFQRHVNAGRFVVKVVQYDRPDGSKGASMTTYATPKGLDYIRKVVASLGFESPQLGGSEVR